MMQRNKRSEATCPRCYRLEERGVSTLVCGGCYEGHSGVRLSVNFIARRLLARNQHEIRRKARGSG